MDDRITEEYKSVLFRAELAIVPSTAAKLLSDLHASAEYIVPKPTNVTLPDVSDVIFLDCALTGLADCIVTGNKRHFPAKACRGVRILSPAEFIREFSQRK